MLRILVAGAIAIILGALTVRQFLATDPLGELDVSDSPIEAVEQSETSIAPTLNTPDRVRERLNDAMENERLRQDRIQSIQ